VSDEKPIGSFLPLRPEASFSLRRAGLRLAYRALLGQLFLGAVWLAGQTLEAEPILLSFVALLISAFNLAMWVGVFAPTLYNWIRGRSDEDDRWLIVGQLSELLKLGLAVPEALKKLSSHQQSSWRTRFSSGYYALHRLAEATAAGDGLGQAMAREGNFPEYWSRLLIAAESKEMLPPILDRLYVNRIRHSWFTLWIGLRFVLLWFVGLPIAFFLVTYILPTFVTLFEGMSVQLPLPTQILIALVKAGRSPLGSLVMYGLPLLGVYLWVRYSLNPVFRRRVTDLLCQMPPFNRVVSLEDQAEVAAVLSCSLGLGLAEDEALEVAAAAVHHPDYARALGLGKGGFTPAHRDAVGGSIAEALERHPGLFAAPLRWLAAQGQRHGNLQEALAEASAYFEDQAQNQRIRVGVWMDQLTAFSFGLAILGVVLATMMPLSQFVVTLVESLVMP